MTLDEGADTVEVSTSIVQSMPNSPKKTSTIKSALRNNNRRQQA